MNTGYMCFEMKRKLLSQIEDAQESQLPMSDMVQSSFDAECQAAVLTIEIAGTQYEGRSQRLEGCAVGDNVRLVRESHNQYSSNTIAVTTTGGESLGNLPAQVSEPLSPLLDAGYATLGDARISYLLPLSKRGGRARKAILYVTFDVKLNMPDYPEDGCTICFLGGDQVRCWAQKLEVLRCKMLREDAVLIFEIYNRMHDEYNPAENETFYCGLENLAEEVTAARAKMRREMIPGLVYGPTGFDEIEGQDGYDGEGSRFYRFAMYLIKTEPDRYGRIKEYIENVADPEEDDWAFQAIFRSDAYEEESFYWTDYARVSERDFNDYSGGYNHWYDVAELFGAELPVDIYDPDVVTIFGTDDFLAFADLSYGC